VEYRYTKHQVARGSLPDAESHDSLLLIKRVSEMRATYQVRLLTFFAIQTGRKLTIELPKKSKLHKSLKDFRKQFPSVVKIVRR